MYIFDKDRILLLRILSYWNYIYYFRYSNNNNDPNRAQKCIFRIQLVLESVSLSDKFMCLNPHFPDDLSIWRPDAWILV